MDRHLYHCEWGQKNVYTELSENLFFYRQDYIFEKKWFSQQMVVEYRRSNCKT